MTDPIVPEDDRRVRYVVSNPSGQGTFEVDFPVDPIYDSGSIVGYGISVYVNDEEIAAEDFTFDPDASEVVLDTDAAQNDIVVLEGDTFAQRDLNYQLRGGLPSARLNSEANKFFYMIQELKRDFSRVVQLAKSLGGSTPKIVEAPVAGCVPIYNTDLNFENGPSLSDLAAITAALGDIGTVADSIADVNTVADDIADVNTCADNMAAILAAPTEAANAAASATAAQNAQSASEAAADGMKWRPSVRAATTANITLSGAQTIDGVSIIAGDRVLVKNQSTASQNGVYVCAAGSWTRATDADAWAELVGQVVVTEEGSTQLDTPYICTVNAGGTIGSTSVTWTTLPSAIADSSITTAKIADANVTTAKVADANITAAKLASDAVPKLFQGRLTLTSGTPVTTADVTAATNVYLTPYRGNQIALYTGTVWQLLSFTEITHALGTITSGRPYDVFAYISGGAVAVEKLAWTNDSTRATGLTTQDGVLVKSGDATRRYVGTFYTTSTTTTEDSAQNRYLFNAHNPVDRSLVKTEATASWNYSTASFQQANNSTANEVRVMRGLDEEAVELSANAYFSNGAASNVIVYVGIGIDSSTVNSAQVSAPNSNYATASNFSPVYALYSGCPGVGRKTLRWLEYGFGSGTQTWRGTNAPAIAGLIGKTRC